MFFGAANLIFPPFLGAQAGSATPLAAAGFIISAVGLPVLGVLAVSSAGGFEYLADRVSPKFAIVLALAIILTIGPCFAIPRTATTSFEMMVVPFTTGIPTWITQLIYSAVFFILSFLLAQRPEILSKTLGRFMGPLLLVMIAVLFVACLIIPHDAFPAPSGDYAQLQLSRGFLDGYQTMDLLAALYFGIVISANVRQMGITSVSQNRRETGYAGLGTGILLVAIYGALAFIGMVSGSITPVDPATDTGATVLTNLSHSAFGPVGTAFLGVIFVVACFNVCTGLISTCGTFFHSHFPTVAGRPVSYRVWSAIFAAVQLPGLQRGTQHHHQGVGAGAVRAVPHRHRAGGALAGPRRLLLQIPARLLLGRAAGRHRQHRQLLRRTHRAARRIVRLARRAGRRHPVQRPADRMADPRADWHAHRRRRQPGSRPATGLARRPPTAFAGGRATLLCRPA